MKVKRDSLWEQWQCALQEETTADCRDGACQECGVCDFIVIKPRVHTDSPAMPPRMETAALPSKQFVKLQVTFTKTEEGRYWGHLEMVNIFVRALRRAGIELQFSQGFHPKPKLRFDDALPIGLESLCESLVLSVSNDLRPEALAAALNRELPTGLTVVDCGPYLKLNPGREQTVVYRVALSRGGFDPETVRQFEARPTFLYERRNRKGKLKKIDLKAMVDTIHCPQPATLEIALRCRPEALLRPDVILREVFHLPETEIRQARIVKLRYQPHATQPPADSAERRRET